MSSNYHGRTTSKDYDNYARTTASCALTNFPKRNIETSWPHSHAVSWELLTGWPRPPSACPFLGAPYHMQSLASSVHPLVKRDAPTQTLWPRNAARLLLSKHAWACRARPLCFPRVCCLDVGKHLPQRELALRRGTRPRGRAETATRLCCLDVGNHLPQRELALRRGTRPRGRVETAKRLIGPFVKSLPQTGTALTLPCQPLHLDSQRPIHPNERASFSVIVSAVLEVDDLTPQSI